MIGLGLLWPIAAYRARRLFFRRIWRILRGFLFGLEIANVTVPTRRTDHSLFAGVLFSVSIRYFPILPERLVTMIIADISIFCRGIVRIRPRYPPINRLGPVFPSNQFAAEMELTEMVSPLSVPVTFTLAPANCSGVFWSLSW